MSNFLHLENGSNICGNNLTVSWGEGEEIDCCLFIEYFSVDKMNGPDLHVSTWVTLKSIKLCYRRQTTKRYFTRILLCVFCKHTKQNEYCLWTYTYALKVKEKCMQVLSTKDCLVSEERERKRKLWGNGSISVHTMLIEKEKGVGESALRATC